MATSSHTDIPTLSEIRNKTQRVFGRRPCLWQLKAAQAVLKNDKDVICISGTGSGKTLTFWMPLLFRREHIQIVVTPLNILGKQNVDQLARVGIDAISITRDTATAQNFKDIGDGRYQAIVVNPEILLMNGGQFEALWKNKPFVARLLSFIWDEAHCVKTWSEFRGQYKEASRLRYLIPRSIPFFLASATLPPRVLADVMTTLQIRRDQYVLIQRSNDRPNVHISVRKIRHSLSSYADLSFLIPEHWTPDQPPPSKFIVFFDNIPESMAATDYLRSRLPEEYWEKIKWFNADMTGEFREEEVKKMLAGDVWGLCCTDSFGMGIDLPDIKIVVQWRASCSMCTLWQRFGRGARDQSFTAKAVFLVEPRYFDDEKQKKGEAKIKRMEKAATVAKRKAEEVVERSRKVAVIGSSSANCRVPVDSPQPVNGTDRTMTPQPNTTHVSGMAQCAERRYLYNQPGEHSSGKALKKTDPDELEPALDDMVNAANRPWKCFRAPSMVYFGNDKLDSSHEDCSPTGCTRCAPPCPSTGQVCCELCTPSAFADIVIPAPAAPTKRVTAPPPKGAQRFKHDFKMDKRDGDLQRELHEFRKQEMQARYGPAMANNLGPSAIMSDEVLTRIVACAHANRIETIDHLKQEVKWLGLKRYGTQVITMILKHRAAGTDSSRPPPSAVVRDAQESAEDRALTTVSPQTRGGGGGGGGGEQGAVGGHGKDVGRTVQKRTCGKCGAVGHISRNKRCPLFSPKNTQSSSSGRKRAVPGDQNLPPRAGDASAVSPPRLVHDQSHPSLPVRQPTESPSPETTPGQASAVETLAQTQPAILSALPTTPQSFWPGIWNFTTPLPAMPIPAFHHHVGVSAFHPLGNSPSPHGAAAHAMERTSPQASTLAAASEHFAMTPVPTARFYAENQHLQPR